MFKRGRPMDFMVITSILLTIVIVVLILSFVKNAFKIVLIIFFVFGLVLGIGTFLVLKEAKDLKDNFLVEDKLFLLNNNDKIITAFSLIDIKTEDSLKPKKSSDMVIYQNALNKSDFTNLTADYYKVMLFNLSVFDNSLENGLSLPNEESTNITKEEVMAAPWVPPILRSVRPSWPPVSARH